jgi:hypothetical protein
MSKAAAALDAIADSGLFELIATSVLRRARPDFAGLIHTGVNPSGRAVASPTWKRRLRLWNQNVPICRRSRPPPRRTRPSLRRGLVSLRTSKRLQCASTENLSWQQVRQKAMRFHQRWFRARSPERGGRAGVGLEVPMTRSAPSGLPTRRMRCWNRRRLVPCLADAFS